MEGEGRRSLPVGGVAWAELSWVLCINYKPIIGESRSANPAIGNSRDRVGGTIEAVQNNVLNVLRAKLC